MIFHSFIILFFNQIKLTINDEPKMVYNEKGRLNIRAEVRFIIIEILEYEFGELR